VYPYLLRGLTIERPNQVWCADITYIPMAQGFLYLVAVMDWATRKVLAWRVSNTMDVEFYGPNPQIGCWYLAALRAGAEMAAHIGEADFAARCQSLFDSGSKWIDENLFNGRWYEQHIVPAAKPDEIAVGLRHDGSGARDVSDPDLQIGPGCLTDQLVGEAAALTDTDRRSVADAARNNSLAAVRLMLASGLPVDVRGQHGGTPLHWAAFHGNIEMTREILRYNPPLELTDADFQSTPLGWAIYGSEHGWYCRTGDYAATVELLLKAGAALSEKQTGGTEAVKGALRRFGAKPLN